MERENLNYVFRMGFMSQFIFEVLEKDRNYYNSLSWKEFQNTDLITEKLLGDFQNYTRAQNISLKINTYKPLVKRYLKATMAQQLYGPDEFQRLINEDDRIIEKVIELSKSN